jgi:hypothetical protein
MNAKKEVKLLLWKTGARVEILTILQFFGNSITAMTLL